MKKKIVTLHPLNNLLEKGIFNRDVGQIGYTFKTEKGYDSEIWCLKTEKQENFEIEGQKWYGSINPVFLYIKLITNARKISILHLYHIFKYSFLSSIIYKLVNPKGIIYIKMDTPLFKGKTDNRLEILKINKYIINFFFKIVNYIGFENKVLLDFYKKTFPKYKKKFILTTSGAINIKSFINNIKKENSIVMCGTFGRKVKNNELLFNVLEKNNIDFLENWKFILIGNYTDDFHKKLENLFIKKPKLKRQIILKGYINNKFKLYKIISKSKIFLHTSNSEGDPNIQYDAMFCGCFMISTDVGNIKQNYPSDYSMFYKIKDEKELYKNLKKGIEKVENFKNKDYLNIQKYCLENFIWEKSLKNILNKV